MPKKRDNTGLKSDVFDLIIVGGGVAGVEIALDSTKKNYKTALIEPNNLGGVCLNTGCIPTKTLLRSSEIYSEVKMAGEFGINVKSVEINFKKIMQRVQNIILGLRKGEQSGLNNSNLTLFKEYASFVGERKVKVGDQIIEGKKIIIATGSKPHIPSIKGINNVNYFVSGTQNDSKEEILNIKKIPKILIILGGGYIGFEYATFFHELGSEIIILEATGRVLNSVDDEILKVLMDKYMNKDFSIITEANILEIKNEKGMKKIYYENNGEKKFVSGDALLIAAGRVPSTFEMHLEKTNVEKDDKGAIKVNDTFETTCKGIYAVGDVVGRLMFAHTAMFEGKIALSNAMENANIKMDFNAIPWAMFVDPTIAAVGNTNPKGNFGVLKAPFSRATRSEIMGNPNGLLKVWYNKKTEKILGAQMIGINSDSLIGEFSALINCNATLKDLRRVIHIHPTLSEVINAI